MKYFSTRGEAPSLSFEGALLAGLARDGGLYMPETWPHFSEDDIAGLAGLDYTEVAYRVMAPYLQGDPCLDDLREVIDEAYAQFAHPAVTPLRQITPKLWILELFHGPTLAFKDLAMQVVARFMDRALLRSGQRATVLGATSGDTGAAAIEAFRGREAIDVFILHPKGRVTDIQRRQMTTVPDANVFNIAVEGTFDDCQSIVKSLFNDLPLRDRLKLTGVNSINWARIVAQIVYYFTSAVALGAPWRPLSYTVPTGNFGDIFAGYAAKRMGLPINRLVVATNLNDSLPRAFATGIYEPRNVVATTSPSMDIQLASNFERLLFELVDRDDARIRTLMQELQETGKLQMSASELARLKQVFGAYSIPEAEVEETIGRLYRKTGVLIDPHTAVAIASALDERRARDEGNTTIPMVILSTADAAKFPDAVERATGRIPEQPQRLIDRLGEEERCETLPPDFQTVADYIASNARAAQSAEAGA
ncbi:threonine synthase [Methyloligella sp. 2.7D]|uniref:threonine synthase n=1 Tax=unclassified Methyloligella TaxID=2625955 RepID=UPI00157CAE53|nr:threonine synthase [Methyloligella sp. GL2]QKP78325.1 threonine synthase [Methyloligella sp. GL2]